MSEQKGIPLYIDRNGSPIADPSNTIETPSWLPSNDAAMHLVRVLEACRDAKEILQVLCNHGSPSTSKRLIKQLSVPLQNLTQAIESMYKLAMQTPNNRLDVEVELRLKCYQIEFQEGAMKLGQLRMVRNKLTAHLDMVCIEKPDQFWSQINLGDFLKWLSNCLVHAFYFLARDVDIYGWSRDSGHRDVRSLMTVDGTLVDFYLENGEPKTILNVTLAPSPKFAFASELREVIQLYNRLTERVSGLKPTVGCNDRPQRRNQGRYYRRKWVD
jgi:hypothetical protein